MSETLPMDLLTLQSRLKTGIENVFPGKVWIKAEISAIKYRSGGHCYMELSQSAETGLVAKASAIIWNSKFRVLSSFFESVAGSQLQEGMKVLVRVQVNYSELYGLSLIIDDIDPQFTIGEKELERQNTIRRLKEEGLIDLQKELAMPVLPYRIAVISAPDAAGYRDFHRHLTENEYGFVLDIRLFQATMQGFEAPASISEAIAAISSSATMFDVILILRGGGAKLDLSCFDDYSLAATIAKCGIPVFTAIGHDQDYHVCDMVAYDFAKTPTALADKMLEYYIAEDERISSIYTDIRLAVVSKVFAAEGSISVIGRRIKSGFLAKAADLSSRLEYLASSVRKSFIHRVESSLSRLEVLETKISASDPRLIVERGYALAVDEKGRILKSVAGRKAGDNVEILLKDGRLRCEVTGIQGD